MTYNVDDLNSYEMEGVFDEMTDEEIREEYCPELNDLQYKIFKDVTNQFLSYDERKIWLITGSAGTGKTYAANKAIEYIMSKIKDSSKETITISAPTNQAVHNIFGLLSDSFRSLASQRKYVTYKTLHSLLGYDEHIDAYGNKTFKQSKDKEFKVQEFLRKMKVLIIDEGSMIPRQMYEVLLDNFNKYKFSIFFVGDQYQLPPINESHSLIFDPYEIKKLKGKHNKIVLTEIIRQKVGHPILDITKHYTHNTEPVKLLSILKTSNTVLNENVGVQNLKNNNKLDADLQVMADMLETYYTSEEYKKNSTYIKTIAYTNNCVDMFNDLIRGIIYGEKASQGLVIGEKLILNTPVQVDKKSKKFLHVNQEVIVEDYKIDYLAINVAKINFRLKYYDTQISYQDYFSTEYTRIKLLHEDSIPEMNKKLEELKSIAMKHPKGSFMAKKGWTDYYTLRDKFFINTKYAYCVTTHKAQGSTYDNIILVMNDLAICKNPEVNNQLTYTAMTRAKYKLILINS